MDTGCLKASIAEYFRGKRDPTGKDFEILRKTVLLNLVCGIGIAALIPMGILAFSQSNPYLGGFDFAVAGILSLSLVDLRRTGDIKRTSYVGMTAALALFLFLVTSGGVDNSAFVWCYTLPLFAMFLLGSTGGIIASALFLIPTVLFLVIEPDLPFLTSYSNNLKLRFIPSFVVVVGYAWLFEFMRAQAHGNLEQKNEELLDVISELEETRRALDQSRQHLEVKVLERTADLDAANSELEKEIYERERAEATLMTVLNSVEAEIYAVDIESRHVLFLNRKMEAVHGEGLVGKPCREAFEGVNRPCNECPSSQSDGFGEPTTGVRIWEFRNPKTGKWYLNYSRVVRWVDGRRANLVVATDVTDRKASEEATLRLNEELERKVDERTRTILQANVELKHEIAERRRVEKSLAIAKRAAESANQAKSGFLANMSHELRTPLNHIIGFTELVVDHTSENLNETQIEYLNDVLSSSGHLLALINDILDLSKIEAGKMELQLSTVSLRQAIDNSLLMLKDRALKHRVEMIADIGDIPETIRVDETRFKQILYNLLSNAVKFTPDGGRIVLAADLKTGAEVAAAHPKGASPSMLKGLPKRLLQIGISDTGIGLAPANLERVFRQFEQVDSSMNRRYQGTGLGLPLTRELAELHGGAIWAESQGEGCGTTFQFVLPV